MKLGIFLTSRKKDIAAPMDYANTIKKKFEFVRYSPYFYLIPNLTSKTTDMNTFLNDRFRDKKLLFSGKENNMKESKVLYTQLSCNDVILNIKSSPLISIMNTKNGGYSYLGTKLLYIFIPRHEAISYNDCESFVLGLDSYQRKKKSQSSNRGISHKVYFEDKKSNYVDVGIGAARFMPGLYKKSINGVADENVKNVNQYFNYVERTVKKYLPQCLLESLNIALNEIGLEDLSKVGSYKQMKESIEPISSSDGSGCCEKIEYNFMPSASFGCNNLLQLHTDKDMFLSIIHVHARSDIRNTIGGSNYNFESDIVKYFTFNDGTSIALRSGDILVFNPTIHHCVSSNTDLYCNDDVFCVSHYFKSLIAGRNNNNIVCRGKL